MSISSNVVWIKVVAAGAILCSQPGATNADPPQPANQANSNDNDPWARKLAELKDDDWHGAFQMGGNLASLPPDDGFKILQENWEKIRSTGNRQQMLKAWDFASTFLFHPRLLDVLDLGMRDETREVREWAGRYLNDIVLQDFSEDLEAYKQWYAASRGQSMDQIVVAAVQRYVAGLEQTDVNKLQKNERLSFSRQWRRLFSNVPRARQAALDAGILKIVQSWVAIATAPKASPAAVQLAARGIEVIAGLKIGEDDLKRLVTPLLDLEKDSELHRAAVQALERKEFPWAVDLLIETLTRSLYSGNGGLSVDWNAAGVLASIGDPRAIPPMIGMIDADSSSVTVYGVGYFGLPELTGVKYSPFHDGPWWRRWWDANRQKFPAPVQAMAIPDLKKTTHGRQYVSFPEDIDTLQGKLNLAGDTLANLAGQRTAPIGPRVSMMELAREVAKHNDPQAIPTLIGIIDADNSYDTVYGVGYFGLSKLTDVKYSPFHDGAWWRRWWEANRSQFDAAVQAIPIPVFEKTAHGKGHVPFPEDIDTLQGKLNLAGEARASLDVRRTGPIGPRVSMTNFAEEVAKHNDPQAIPTLIGIIDADNSHKTVYGVGYFGLGRLTGVKYDEAHDGAWWRNWWEKNREKYPSPVRDMAIPEFPKRAGASGSKANTADYNPDDADDLADVKDVPAQDLRIGGDDKKRYFLIGMAEQVDSPADRSGLLVVLPGGHGSADFHPFIRRISKNVLPKGWLIAQAVAPQWDEKQFEQVVWPTLGLPYPGAKITTEEFIEGIIADVRAKAKIDPRRIFLLGWSSGGPPCYAAALRKETPVTGAFIAMSVFKPQLVPAIENAKSRTFYLLQSPDDRVTPMRFALDAEKMLKAAGAKVQLQRYDGGHGWQGDVWKMIGDGIKWLENPIVGGTTAAASPLSDPGLEVAELGTPTEKSGWLFMATPGEAGYRIASETDQVLAGKRCARLEQEGTFEGIGFGNLMQVIDAAPYRGKRVRFRAAVRSTVEGAGNQAMLWMRVDRTDKEESGFFDNMHDRPIKAKEWKHYDVVGDVADDASLINLGMVLVGSGKAWLDDASFELVGADVPVTGAEQAKQKAQEVPADKTAANILLNPSFEDGDKSPAEWSQGADIDGVEYSWDKDTARKGKASLCLNKTAKRYFPIAQWFQTVERKSDRPSLEVRAQVKAESVSKAVIDVIFLDENGKSISHEWAAYIGAKEAKDPPADHDWKEYLGKVKIPERTQKLQIGLQIYGPGKVWFDDIQAEYVE